MEKFDLIEMMAETSNVSKGTAERAYDTIIDSITDALKKGERVQFLNFGTFTVAHRAARTRRNPKTGKEIKIPATNVVKFKPGKALGEAVNES